MQIPNINKQKIEEFLKKDKRMDGRGLLDYRDVKIETGISINAEGTARVRIGKTEVIAGVKLNTQEPYADHEDEGTMMVGMEFNPICGDRYELGPPRINAIEVARVVDRGIRESGFIDFKKLCIKKGEKVWVVIIDIYCINDDGNVLDVAALAAASALRTAKMPVYDKKEEKVKFGEFTKEPLPLTDNIPFTITFHEINSKIFIDPDRNEEDTSEGRVTFSISKPKKEYIINAMQKGNMDLISANGLNQMAVESEKIYDKIFPEIDKKIKTIKK